MRRVGLHIRLDGSLDNAIAHSKALELTVIQAFLVQKSYGKRLDCTQQEIERFRTYIDNTALMACAHSSYLVNAASTVPLSAHYVFKREMNLATQLGFTHMIVHPGAPRKKSSKHEGIDALARFVNAVTKKYTALRLVLENVAFAAPSIGGDLHDFYLVLQKIDHPDKLSFCIDTAHAHSYGYDLLTLQGQEQFVHHIEQTIGIQRVALIHLNDTTEQRGSYIDQHAFLAEGTLGKQALQALAMHQQLRSIPLLMELPVVNVEQERKALHELRSWS